MRVLLAEFAHESNSFATPVTGRERFEQSELVHGDAVIEAHRGMGTVLGGMIDGLLQKGHQPVPVFAASAPPSGPVDTTFFNALLDDLLRAAERNKPDAVLLSLHGGMSVSEDGKPDVIDDPEGAVVTSLRHVLGPDVPMGVVMDLHSDTTDRLLEATDITLAFNEEPHRDGAERGHEIAGFIDALGRGAFRTAQVRIRAPMLLTAINMATDQGPMADLHQIRREQECLPGVLDVSIHAGFYGSDQSQAGFSVVCTTTGDRELAHEVASNLAWEAWNMRETFLMDLVRPADGVARALAEQRTIALVDEADDPAGGGACDGVELLRAMIEGGITSGGVSTVFDPETVTHMAEAGLGAELDVVLGARTDMFHGKPLACRGIVRQLTDKPVPKDGWSSRMSYAGLIGVLDVGGILVIVTQRRLVTENIDLFEHLGFDVRTMQAIVFKGITLHVRQALEGKISVFLPVDGVGVTHPDVTGLGPYQRLIRPCWPFDPHLAFPKP
jgi:microcystin degradation protein MlrC